MERESNNQTYLLSFSVAIIAVCLAIVGFVLPAQDGTIDPSRYDDLNFPALSLGKGANAPTQATLFGGTLEGLKFDGVNKLQEVFGSGEILHSYEEGTDLEPHVHWMPTTTDAGDVQWFLEYTWINKNGTYIATSTINATQAAGGTAWTHNFAEFPAINGTGYYIGSQIVFKLYRNATATNDTYGADAALLSFGIHYQMDSVGSTYETSK